MSLSKITIFDRVFMQGFDLSDRSNPYRFIFIDDKGGGTRLTWFSGGKVIRWLWHVSGIAAIK